LRPRPARMVREGQVVILDSGTTTTAIARALRKFQNLTIITNAVNIAAELSGSSLEVILTGGTLREELILAGGADCGRDAEAAERGHSFSRRGWFRRATWIDYTEPALRPKVNRAMMDVGQGCGCGVRLQQVRATQLIFNCSTFGSATT